MSISTYMHTHVTINAKMAPETQLLFFTTIKMRSKWLKYGNRNFSIVEVDKNQTL